MVVLKIFWLFWIIFNMQRDVTCKDYIEEARGKVNNEEGRNIVNNDFMSLTKRDLSSIEKISKDSVNEQEKDVNDSGSISVYEGSEDEFEDISDVHSNSSEEDSILSIWNEDSQNLPNTTVEEIFSTTDSDLKYPENKTKSIEQPSNIIEIWIKEKQGESPSNKSKLLNDDVPVRKVETKDNLIKPEKDQTSSTSSRDNQPLLNVTKITDLMQLIFNKFFNQMNSEMANKNNKTSPLLILLGPKINLPGIFSEIVRAKDKSSLPVQEVLARLLTGSFPIINATSQAEDVPADGKPIHLNEISKDNQVRQQDEVKKDNDEWKNYKKTKSVSPLASSNNKTLVTHEVETSKDYIEKGYTKMEKITTSIPEIRTMGNVSSIIETIYVTTEETFSTNSNELSSTVFADYEEFTEEIQYDDAIDINKSIKILSTSAITLTDYDLSTNQEKSTEVFNTSQSTLTDDDLSTDQEKSTEVFDTSQSTLTDDDLSTDQEKSTEVFDTSQSTLTDDDLSTDQEKSTEVFNISQSTLTDDNLSTDQEKSPEMLITSQTTLTDDDLSTNQQKTTEVFNTPQSTLSDDDLSTNQEKSTKTFNTSQATLTDDDMGTNHQKSTEMFNTSQETLIDSEASKNNKAGILSNDESSTPFEDFEVLEDIKENNKKMPNSRANKEEDLIEKSIFSTTFDPKIQELFTSSDDINQSDNLLNNEEPPTTSLPADAKESTDQSNISSVNASFLHSNKEDVSVGPDFCGYVCINETLCISLNISVTLFINNTVIYLPREAVVITGWEAEDENAKMVIEWSNLWSNLENNSFNLSILINVRCGNGHCFVDDVQIKVRNDKTTGMKLDRKLKGELVVERSNLELFRTSLGSIHNHPSYAILEFDNGIVLGLSNVSITTYEHQQIPNFSATSSPFERYYLEILVAASVASLILGCMSVVLCWMCRKTRNFKLNIE